MRRKFTTGILFSISFVIVVFALSSWGYLKENTQPSNELAAENTFRHLYEQQCPPREGMLYTDTLSITDEGIYFSCTHAAGHSNNVMLWYFASSDEARVNFDERRESNPITDFHGYPSSYFEKPDYMVQGGLQKMLVWRVKNMLFIITSFDDTHFSIARDPLVIAEELVQIAREERFIITNR